MSETRFIPFHLRPSAFQYAEVTCELEGLKRPSGFDPEKITNIGPRKPNSGNDYVDRFSEALYDYFQSAYGSLDPTVETNPTTARTSIDIFEKFKWFFGRDGIFMRLFPDDVVKQQLEGKTGEDSFVYKMKKGTPGYAFINRFKNAAHSISDLYLQRLAGIGGTGRKSGEKTVRGKFISEHIMKFDYAYKKKSGNEKDDVKALLLSEKARYYRIAVLALVTKSLEQVFKTNADSIGEYIDEFLKAVVFDELKGMTVKDKATKQVRPMTEDEMLKEAWVMMRDQKVRGRFTTLFVAQLDRIFGKK